MREVLAWLHEGRHQFWHRRGLASRAAAEARVNPAKKLGLYRLWYCYTTRAIEAASKLGFTRLSRRQLGIE
jgi:hypothetical protein